MISEVYGATSRMDGGGSRRQSYDECGATESTLNSIRQFNYLFDKYI